MKSRILALAVLLFALLSFIVPATPRQPAERVLVSGFSANHSALAVERSGGNVERILPIIDGVSARLTPQQQISLRTSGFSVAPNGIILANHGGDEEETQSSGDLSDGIFPAQALGLGSNRLTGKGVTVALVDSGLPFTSGLSPRSNGRPRGAPKDGSLFASLDGGQFVLYKDFLSSASHSQDPYGHGTHVAGIIAGPKLSTHGSRTSWRGVAPGANLVVARAIGADGSGTYADVIAAIDWIVANKQLYKIRVLNLSLYANVASPYWADLLNLATMRAWQSGLVVITTAGNNGPGPLTVTVPGNVPYVVTVGAFRSARLSESGEDELTSFSGRGPTESAFVKPDLLAPGVRIVAPLPLDSALAATYGDRRVSSMGTVSTGSGHSKLGFFKLGGTSMAAAETSGLVALLLEKRPQLNNDQVKWLLSRTTQIAIDPDTNMPAFSIWEQGFGKLDAEMLFDYRGSVGSANQGLNIGPDMDYSASGVHYIGWTSLDQNGNFYIDSPDTDGIGYFNWTGASATWAGATWAGQTWANATWAGATWAGATWAGQTWTGATWAGTVGDAATWAGATWAGATWSGASWAGQTWYGDGWAGATWSGASWAGASWAGASWAGATWSGASWAGATWSGASWAGGPIADD